jgi:hypothetical protein
MGDAMDDRRTIKKDTRDHELDGGIFRTSQLYLAPEWFPALDNVRVVHEKNRKYQKGNEIPTSVGMTTSGSLTA